MARFEILLVLRLDVKVTNQNVEELTRVDPSMNVQRSKTIPKVLDLEFTKTML